MQSLQIRALVALLSAVTLLPSVTLLPTFSAHHPRRRASQRPRFRLPADYPQWTRVAGCESGGWRVLGYAYPDSLGIDRTNFLAFGGTPLPPGSVSPADRVMQIQVADRMITHYHTAVPDEYGCSAW